MARRIRTTANDKRLHRSLCADHAGALDDYHERLQNALRALAQADPNLPIFLVEIETDPEVVSERALLQLVESRARAIYLRNYGNLYRTSLIFSPHYSFGPTGNLIMG